MEEREEEETDGSSKVQGGTLLGEEKDHGDIVREKFPLRKKPSDYWAS